MRLSHKASVALTLLADPTSEAERALAREIVRLVVDTQTVVQAGPVATLVQV